VLSTNEDSGRIIAKDDEFDLGFKNTLNSNSKVAGRFGYFGDNTESANFNDEIPVNTQLLLDFFGGGGVGTQLDYNKNTYFDHSSTTTSSNTNNTFFIGQRFGKVTFNGKMQEIIFYDSKKSSDRSSIKTALDNYYKVPGI